jgi:hypothetical protein
MHSILMNLTKILILIDKIVMLDVKTALKANNNGKFLTFFFNNKIIVLVI